ncbi:MAG TPA: hydroxymethylbilane synthase [Pirellulales bacterium]|jgi:hydroxymethylbilane synthase|nr:hydroxymethylbilane synthase [Pirellulales bacterium]
MNTSPIRLGTRNSPLARWQAEWVAEQLRRGGHTVELVPISTRGDRVQSESIATIGGGDGVFTKELQRALLAGTIDLAVHSLKDLPTEPVAGLAVLAVPERGPVGDVLIGRVARSLDELPQGSTVGTGSLRRRTQLWHVRPDLRMAEVRGNVDTRLRKLDEGQFDALCLAEAGLHRLRLDGRVTQVIPRTVMLPAVGQGALGLEGRSDDARVAVAIAALDHPATHAAVTAERTMLRTIGGGCLAPIGAWGRIADGRLRLDAVVLSLDGKTRLAASVSGELDAAAGLGEQAAAMLLAQGAAALIEACRQR